MRLYNPLPTLQRICHTDSTWDASYSFTEQLATATNTFPGKKDKRWDNSSNGNCSIREQAGGEELAMRESREDTASRAPTSVMVTSHTAHWTSQPLAQSVAFYLIWVMWWSSPTMVSGMRHRDTWLKGLKDEEQHQYLSWVNLDSFTLLNLLWPTDAIWQHRSGSTMAQVMPCCLMAQSH